MKVPSSILSQTQEPILADVILKIKQQEELTAQEELIYLVHFENMPYDEATALIDRWYTQNT